MIIRDEHGKYWSDEQATAPGSAWYQIPESSISYDIWTLEPSESRKAELRAAHLAAYRIDQSEFRVANPNAPMWSDLLLSHAPHAAMVEALPDYRAMVAYDAFRLARLESVL